MQARKSLHDFFHCARAHAHAGTHLHFHIPWCTCTHAHASYTYMHTHIKMHAQVHALHMHAPIHAHTHTCTLARTRTHAHAHVHAHAHTTLTHACAHTCKHMHAHASMHEHTRAYARTHTHLTAAQQMAQAGEQEARHGARAKHVHRPAGGGVAEHACQRSLQVASQKVHVVLHRVLQVRRAQGMGPNTPGSLPQANGRIAFSRATLFSRTNHVGASACGAALCL